MTNAQNLSAVSRPGSIKDAARENSVHPDTIRRRIARGELHAWKLGERIVRIDLDEASALFRLMPTAKAG
jgi:excisionase family DNA binding protein